MVWGRSSRARANQAATLSGRLRRLVGGGGGRVGEHQRRWPVRTHRRVHRVPHLLKRDALVLKVELAHVDVLGVAVPDVALHRAPLLRVGRKRAELRAYNMRGEWAHTWSAAARTTRDGAGRRAEQWQRASRTPARGSPAPGRGPRGIWGSSPWACAAPQTWGCSPALWCPAQRAGGRRWGRRGARPGARR